MGSSLLEASDVDIRFGGVHAVQKVSLSVPKGTVYGIIGPNGAGKTTFFDAISGHNKLSSGSIMFTDLDISQHSASWRARKGIRRTFQRQQTIGSLTVEDNVLLGSEWHGGGGGLLADLVALPSRTRRERARREKVTTVLEWCGLDAFRSTLAGSLPIGHARLVELARAVIDEPLLLLLDEPTGGMSASEVETLRKVMDLTRQEFGTTTIIVEHDIPFVMSVCERILVLNLGQVVADGTPDEVRAHEGVRQSYFGVGSAGSSAQP